MSTKGKEKEEYLESLWEMKEQEKASIDDLKTALGSVYESDTMNELVLDGLVEINNQRIVLTAKGEEQARQIIRAHRLGERLLYDMFGEEFEDGACEFEHIKATGLVDGICTLLGHPRECPHGLPIPEGECCRRLANTAIKAVTSLAEMEIGQAARVAYIDCKDDRRMHHLNGLQIKPGASIRLHQRYPCYVVDCEGANIALDEDIASNIRVWSNLLPYHPEQKTIQFRKEAKNWWKRLFRGNQES